MGRYFGGRFGDMLSPTATNPNTKAVLSLRDNYYMTRSGGLTTPVSTITELNSRVSWTHLPNYDIYTTTNQSGNANYNGSRFRITGNIGQLEFNSYEYPCYGKFDIRGGDTSKDSFFQLYAFQGTPANFHSSTTKGNLFQMGVYWESSPNSGSLTNSLEATNAVANGEAAYFVTDGYGIKTWGWYSGGSNSNSQVQGTQNREHQETIDWSGQSITFVCYGQSAGSNSQKIKVYKANTLIRTMTVTITSGRPVYIYLGAGYPDGLHTQYSAGLPKFRYGNLDAGNTAL